MSRPPVAPKIYHITHVDNLPQILATGGLWSDAQMLQQSGAVTTIGMSRIKRRRLDEIEVYCHPGTMVGDYVPFYFCPRSIMLCTIYYRNSPDLAYRGGQDEIVHLESDLYATLDWAESQGRPWAFSLSNAGARDVVIRDQRGQLNQINWEAMPLRVWNYRPVSDDRQAEFLIHNFFDWSLVTRIGVHSRAVGQRAYNALRQASFPMPTIEIKTQEWYHP